MLWLLLSLLVVDSKAQPVAGLPFAPGEKLVFALKWGVVPAGEAELEVLPIEELDGQPVLHFVLTVRSNSFVDVFYKVRDRTDAYVDLAMNHSVFYKKDQHEGRSRRDIMVTFDWQKGEARYSNFGQENIVTKLLPGSFDPLAIMYYIRTRELVENEVIEQPVTDGKKSVIGRTSIKEGKDLKLAGRTIETWLLEPELKHIGGVFEKSKNARMRLWLSKDRHKIPVKLKSKVVVGSFTAELIAVDRPAEIRGLE